MRRIQIEILGDASQLERTFRRASASTNTFGREVGRAERGALAGAVSFRGMGRSIAFASAQFLGGYGLVFGIRKSIDAASDLQAQQQRTGDVFKDSSASVDAWANNSVEKLGMAKAATLDAADTVGTLLERTGKIPAKAAEMSKAIVQLAVDEAAFKKVAPETALSAFEAALSGRTRGLKQFGLLIDSVAIKKEAIGEGLVSKNFHGQLNAAQKSLAIYSLLLKQSRNEQGTFARSQGEAAIQSRIFHAAITETEASIGQAFLPEITRASGGIASYLSKASTQATIQRDVASAVNVTTSSLKTFFRIGSAVADTVGGWKHAFELLIALKVGKVLFGWGSQAVAAAKTFKAMATAQVAASSSASTTEIANNTRMSLSWEALTGLINANTTALERNAVAAKLSVGTGTFTGGFSRTTGTVARTAGAAETVAVDTAAAGGLAGTGEKAVVTATRLGKLRVGAALLSRSLGTAGLAATAGIASYELTSLALKATHADTIFRKLGGAIAGDSGKFAQLSRMKDPVPTQATATAAIMAARAAVLKIDPADLVPQDKTEVIGRFLVHKVEESVAQQQLEATLKAQFHLSDHDVHIFVQSTIDRLEQGLSQADVQAEVNVKVTHGLGLAAPSAVDTTVVQHAKQSLDSLSKITAALGSARLDAARNVAGAEDRIIAADRALIAFDEHYIAVQESLISRGIGDAKKHAATIDRLRSDEAGAFSEISGINQQRAADQKQRADALRTAAETFELPAKLQIAAAKAATTATTKDDIAVAIEIRAFAMAVIKSGKKRGQAIVDAYDAIASANDTINQVGTGFQIPLKLQLAQAKASATATTADDIAVAKRIRDFAKQQLRSHKLSVQDQIAAYDTIAQENQVIGGQDGDPTPTYHMAGSHSLTRGLGLSRNARIALEQNIAQKEAHHGYIPNSGVVGALGMPVRTGGDTIEININGGDIAEVRRVVSEVLRKERRVHAAQRSGRRGGLTMGIS